MQLSQISLAITRLGGLPFSPAGLFSGGTQGVWYDPSDSTTLFSDTAGTTPSPTPGAGALSVVGRMLDKSGNGNHAISYNTTTARPELSARVNLLTYSEQFDNAAWSKSDVTVTADNAVAPDGTTTADKLIESATTAVHVLIGSVTAGSTTLKLLCYAKQAERQYFGLTLYATGGSGGDSTLRYAIFDLSNGTVTGQSGVNVGSPTITPVGNNWYRCSIEYTYPGTYTIQPRLYVTTSPTSLNSYAGNGTSGIFIWGADLRPSNIGTSVPAYQRIADQYTYDSSGFPRYLVFNGTASGMYTPANLNLGTDKATVFAGVRKLSDAAGAILTEFSANAGSNNGAFYVSAPDGSAATDYGFGLRSTQITGFKATTFAAPISNVISCVYDTAGLTRATEIYPKINGVIPTLSGTGNAESGSGNFGTYALNIGVRSAAATPSAFLNGNIYSLIVVGAASTAAQISSTESWINVKEGTVY